MNDRKGARSSLSREKTDSLLKRSSSSDALLCIDKIRGAELSEAELKNASGGTHDMIVLTSFNFGVSRNISSQRQGPLAETLD